MQSQGPERHPPEGDPVSLEEVCVFRNDAGQSRSVVDQLTLKLAPGSRTMLVGPNGAGKTSLLLAMVGAVPFTGRIQIAGQELTKRSLLDVRRRIGFVFSNPSEQLFCETVDEEVGFGPKQRGLEEAEIRERVATALGRVGMSAALEHGPQRLSLGEQRRVATAAAFALHPGLLLFDEPTSSLDPLAREAVLDAIKTTPSTVLMASHDLDAAETLGAQVVLLHRGKHLATGTASEIQADHALMVRAGLRRH